MSDVYATRSAVDAGLVMNAPDMNKTEVNGYVQDRTFATMFPPVCLKSHWDAESLSTKYVLPGDLGIPLPVDPRPLVKNCTTYVTSTPANVWTPEAAEKRGSVGLTAQPGGSASRGVPYEVYVRNVNAESDLFLNHPQDKCDDNKWQAGADSDLFTNRAAPPQKKAESFLELARPIATIVPKGPYNCRVAVDESSWSRSSRLFNNPTREDRVPGAAARASEALLSKKGAVTARVATTPRVWPSNSIVFYCGPSAGNGGDTLMRLAQALRARDWEVTIFTPGSTRQVEGLVYQHVGEFVPNDMYSCLVLWSTSDLLANFQYKPQARALVLSLQDADDNDAVCDRTVKDMVDKIIVRSAYHRSLYNCYGWSKFEIIPDALPTTLFTDAENRALSRERGRVLVTEYTMDLVAFVQQAWTRVKSTYPGAELHVWSSAGDEKTKVSALLSGSARGLGIVLHGKGSDEEMVRERFKSNCHLILDREAPVSSATARLSVLGGCIPIMPATGAYNEIRGVNVPGAAGAESTMIDYAKAISGLFRDEAGANDMRRRGQMDESLKGYNATADEWLRVLKGLRESEKPYSIGAYNSLFN